MGKPSRQDIPVAPKLAPQLIEPQLDSLRSKQGDALKRRRSSLATRKPLGDVQTKTKRLGA